MKRISPPSWYITAGPTIYFSWYPRIDKIEINYVYITPAIV